jgi:heavy metal translocating P-type ATPase
MSAVAACAFCGLPLAGGGVANGRPRYCCFGCRFAAAVSKSQGDAGWNTALLARLGLAIFFTLNVLMFTMVLWSPDLYAGAADSTLAHHLQSLFRYLLALLAAPVLWLLGVPMLQNAWDNLKARCFSADWLLLLGVVAAYVYSLYSTWNESGAVYYEVGCVVLVLVTLGRWLEATGKQRTLAALAALDHWLPTSVRQLDDEREAELPLADVQPGMLLKVLPGERVPTDGVVERQPAAVDEQWLTGEGTPRVKEVGDPIYGGTHNVDGVLFLRTSSRPGEGTLARFVELIRAALRRKGRFERLADRISLVFLPCVVALAIFALAWHGWRSGLEAGMLAALSVLLISCPCALGIATPLAIWTALGEAGRRQVLFRSAESLEKLPQVDSVFFDKTGTLTTGRPRLVAAELRPGADGAEARSLTATLASSSNHPLALALRAWSAGANGQMVHSCRAAAGRGVVAQRASDHSPVWLGSRKALTEAGLALDRSLAGELDGAEANGASVSLLGYAGRIQALFRFNEELRPEAPAVLQELWKMGKRVTVLTGDHAGRASALARQLGVEVYGDLLPEAKVAAVGRAKGEAGLVMMVGDGINDAPALAASDLGVALGCGADLAREAADICLLTSDLRQLPWLFKLAERTINTIRINLFWAFVYNVAGIGLALAGWLNPIWAALAMVLSSGFVVGNSLRLRAPPLVEDAIRTQEQG